VRACIGVPQRLQYWWLRSQSTICSARPDSAASVLSTMPKRSRRPSVVQPAGSGWLSSISAA
jgi:hypothetical protein